MTKIPYKDPSLDRFTKSNLFYEKDPYIMYQDPTVLGFKLMFNYNQPGSGLLSTIPHPNTAMGYLTRIGADDRVYYLGQFVNTLIEINRRTPWYFQTIEGLGEAWKRGFNEDAFSPKIPSDRMLTIGCLESIDLRMSALIDLYRKACFDWKNMREIVPWNLRTFSMKIYVYEATEVNRAEYNKPKKIENAKLLGEDPDPRGETRGSDVNLINDKISRFMLDFGQCEIMSDESGTFMDSVTNIKGEPITQKIAIKYRQLNEENLYNLYSDKYVSDQADYLMMQLDRAALDDPRLLESSTTIADDLDDPSYAQRMKDYLNEQTKGFQEEAQQQLEARANGFINSQIGKAVLGNIYGFSPAAIRNALNNGINGLINLGANSIGANKSLTNISQQTQPGASIKGPVTPNQPGVATGNNNEGGVGGESDGNPQTSLINYQEGNEIGNISTGNSLENTPGTDSGNMFEP